MIRGLLLLLCAASVGLADEKPARYRVYFGTYTGGTKSKGIYRADLDLKTGALTDVKLAVETSNPSFLAIHPSQKFVYAVGDAPGKGGVVSAFAIDPASGDLKLLNDQPSKGGGPCHIVVDRTGKTALVANYGGGNVSALPIEANGKLGEANAGGKHEPPSRATPRQSAPNAHSINIDPGNRFAVAADLGCDRLFIYKLDPEKATLTPNDPASVKVAPSAGPRHFAFHPSGKFAYVINEILLTMTAFRYDAEKGVLTEIQTLSTIPVERKQGYSTAEVVVHPSGKFLYGSNRGHNSIAIFKIDEETGKLTVVGHQGKTIKTPRNFAIDPTGQFLLVGNQDGHSVSVFKINAKTGELDLVGEPVAVPNPICVRFVPLN